MSDWSRLQDALGTCRRTSYLSHMTEDNPLVIGSEVDSHLQFHHCIIFSVEGCVRKPPSAHPEG